MRTRIRTLSCGLALVAVMLASPSAQAQQSDSDWLARCRNDEGRQARACEARPISVAAPQLIRVDARPNGGISLTGGAGGGISGSARISAQAPTEAEAKAILGEVQINTSGGEISATGPRGGNNRSWSVNFVLSVPGRSDLEVESTNGPVSLTGITGRINAATVNGPMTLTNLGGDVRARTSNGPLTIALEGGAWDGAGLDASTTNGPVNLQIPDGYSAQLDVGTNNGPLSLGIPVTVQGDLPSARHSSIQTVLGGGGAPIKVRTSNGPLRVQQR